MATSSEDRQFLNHLSEKLTQKDNVNDIGFSISVHRSKRSDRFGVNDINIKVDFDTNEKKHNEFFKMMLSIEAVFFKVLEDIIDSLATSEAKNILVFPCLIIPALENPIIQVGGRYLSDPNIVPKCNKTKKATLT